MNMMLNPKIAKFPLTQITAERKPSKTPIKIAPKAHFFSIRKFSIDASKFPTSRVDINY
ncbi:MAG: hypothetical protein QM405_04055 [Euryarchaeota archaeon]|nr:hypothetical protein [Euryarchaeota archaeon]